MTFARRWHALTALVAIAALVLQVVLVLQGGRVLDEQTRPDLPIRLLRLAGVAGIAVTGLVHFVLLRPLLDLEGADYLADKLLHMAVPVLAVAGWAAFGPRPRVTTREIGLALIWPFAWLAEALVVGGLSGWYPYPVLDHREGGAGAVIVACVGITVLFVAVFALIAWIDGRATPRPAPDLRP